MKVGDVIAKVTGKVGIRQCGGCKKSQKLLNDGKFVEGLAMIPGNIASLIRGEGGVKVRKQGWKIGGIQVVLLEGGGEWVVKDNIGEWKFKSEKKAREKFDEVMKSGN